MPDRIDPRLLAAKARLTEPALKLLRPAAPPAPAADLQALQARAAAGAAVLTRADAERLTVVNDALRVLKLGAVPQLPLAHKLSGPGTTVQLGLDFPGAAINAFRAAHVYRSSAGQGSFITLGAPDQMASLDLDVLDSGQGVYLAVVHVAGSANALDARIWLYPNGYIGDTATRSNNKFLIPFEITSYAYLASIYLSLPAGTTGDLDILRVDVTKVT